MPQVVGELEACVVDPEGLARSRREAQHLTVPGDTVQQRLVGSRDRLEVDPAIRAAKRSGVEHERGRHVGVDVARLEEKKGSIEPGEPFAARMHHPHLCESRPGGLQARQPPSRVRAGKPQPEVHAAFDPSLDS